VKPLLPVQDNYRDSILIGYLPGVKFFPEKYNGDGRLLLQDIIKS
jgi:hypothetical protein